MAGIPQNFQSISNVIANYNYVDILSGTGYVNLYAGNTVDKKILSNFTFYSDIVYSTAGASGDNILVLDEDYDTLLNRPIDIRGLGIVNIPIATISDTNSKYCNAYAIIIFRKWDGVTETDIVTNTSRILSNTTITRVYSMLAVDLNIPLTHFKPGETLRLTVRIYASIQVGFNTGTVWYGHDPKSRSSDWDTTGAVPSQLSFQCPVRLNL